jgi:hypothetical protein
MSTLAEPPDPLQDLDPVALRNRITWLTRELRLACAARRLLARVRRERQEGDQIDREVRHAPRS